MVPCFPGLGKAKPAETRDPKKIPEGPLAVYGPFRYLEVVSDYLMEVSG